MGCDEIREIEPNKNKNPAFPPKTETPKSEPNQPKSVPPKPVENGGLILIRTKGNLDKENSEFSDCIISTEEEFQNQIKFNIASYMTDEHGETQRNIDDEILTHSFMPDFTKQVVIAVNGIHVNKIERVNNKFCIFHDNSGKSKYYYEAFICNSIAGVIEFCYNPPVKPNFSD